jgi:hypothetical protein
VNRAAFIIQTCTINANLAEDRIRMDAVDSEGTYQAIWLTRRLVDQFVPHLATHAEKQVQSGIPPAIKLSMDQQALRTERAEQPTPPVPVQPAVTPWLCITMHLKHQTDGLVWTLTDDRMIDAHMVLTGMGIRAMLDVFLTSYRALGWDEAHFPDWAREAAAPARSEPRVLN